jgi:hypothetical protein
MPNRAELSVEGPDFARRVEHAEKVVQTLQNNRWDFASAAEDIFAKDASADVIGKEIAVIFDGDSVTRVGRLVMGGHGTHFNLMGPIPPNSIFKMADSDLLDSITHQTGSEGVWDFPEMQRYGHAQKVDFYNYTFFYQLRDLLFWSVLHGSGCFPSTLEHMKRQFAAGQIVQNLVYNANVAHAGQPVIMQARCMSVSFASKVVEWMDRPLYGGFAKDTVHLEYLLTPTASKVSHPYLPLVDEGKIEYRNQKYYIRRFGGVTPKQGVRGPDVKEEAADNGGDTGTQGRWRGV